jgi:hypothetical protein
VDYTEVGNDGDMWIVYLISECTHKVLDR